jgi:hypothetical protein
MPGKVERGFSRAFQEFWVHALGAGFFKAFSAKFGHIISMAKAVSRLGTEGSARRRHAALVVWVAGPRLILRFFNKN